MGRTVIVTGTGNNGSQPWHAGGILQQGKTEEIQLAVGAFEPTLNVQLWKDYEDEMEIYLESPSGERIGPLYERLGPQRHLLENTELLIYYGKPGPYQLSQEIYIDFIPEGNYVDSGVWKVLLSGLKFVRLKLDSLELPWRAASLLREAMFHIHLGRSVCEELSDQSFGFPTDLLR